MAVSTIPVVTREEPTVPAPTAVSPRAGAGRAGSERRALAGHAVIALLVAALGLVVAASLSLTTSAEVTGGRPAQTQAGPATPGRDGAVRQPNRSVALRTALVQEVAAQRSEQLVKAAEAVDRSARTATGTARQEKLAETSRSTQASAAQIAQQRLAAARAARQAAQLAATTDGTVPPEGATPAALPAGTTGVLPVPSGVVGAHFGQYGSWSRYHTGLDFRAAYGTPIRAVLPGVVLYAGNSGDWAGNHVAIRHADGQTTMYSHMSSMAASVGQTVQAGQVIGYVGQTGRAFGAHLHFELYPVGVTYGDVYKAVDPMPWLRSIGVQTR